MSLFVRLLLLVAAALLPAIGVQVYAARQAREDLVHEEPVRLARAAAIEQARLVDGTRLLMTAIAQMPIVAEGAGNECVSYFPPALAVGGAGAVPWGTL